MSDEPTPVDNPTLADPSTAREAPVGEATEDAPTPEHQPLEQPQRQFTLAGTEVDLNRIMNPVFSDHLADILALLVMQSTKHTQSLAFMEAWSAHLEDMVEDPDPSLLQRAQAWRYRQAFAPWKEGWIKRRRGSRVKAKLFRKRHQVEWLRDIFYAWQWTDVVRRRLEAVLSSAADGRCTRALRTWDVHGRLLLSAVAVESMESLKVETSLLRARVSTATAALQAEQSAHQQALLLMKGQIGSLELSRKMMEPVIVQLQAQEAPGGVELVVHRDADRELFQLLSSTMAAGADDSASEAVERWAREEEAAAPSVSGLRRSLLTTAAAAGANAAGDASASGGEGSGPGTGSFQMGVLALALDSGSQCAGGLLRLVEAAAPHGGFSAEGDTAAVGRALRATAGATANVAAAAAAQVECLSLLAARADTQADLSRERGEEQLAARWALVARSAAEREADTISASAEANAAADQAARFSAELIAQGLRLAKGLSPSESARLHSRAARLAAGAASSATSAIVAVIDASRMIGVEHAQLILPANSVPTPIDIAAALERTEQAVHALRTAANRARAVSVALADVAQSGQALSLHEESKVALEQAANSSSGASDALATARDLAATMVSEAGASMLGSLLRHRPVPGGPFSRRPGTGEALAPVATAAAALPAKPATAEAKPAERKAAEGKAGAGAGSRKPGSAAPRFRHAVAVQAFDESSMTVLGADGAVSVVPITPAMAASLQEKQAPAKRAKEGQTKAVEDALLNSPEFLAQLRRLLGVDSALDPRLLAAIRRVANQTVLALGGEKEPVPAQPAPAAEDAAAYAKAETNAAVAALTRLEKELASQSSAIRKILTAKDDDPLPPELRALVESLPAQARSLETLRADVDALRKRLAPSGPKVDDELESLYERSSLLQQSVGELSAQLAARLETADDALQAFKEAENLVDTAFAARLDKAESAAGAPMVGALSDGDLSGVANAVAAMTARLLTLRDEFEGKTEGLRADVQSVFDKMADTEAAMPRLRGHIDLVQSELLRKLAGSDDLQRSLQEDIAKCASKEALALLDELLASAAKEEDLLKLKELLQEDVNGVALSANEVARRADELSLKLEEMLARPQTGGGQRTAQISGETGALIGVVVQCCRAVDQVMETTQRGFPSLELHPEAKSSIRSQFMPAIVGKGSRVKQYALLKELLQHRFKAELHAIAQAASSSPPTPLAGRVAPRLTDVYIYGDDGRPYRGSLNVEITKVESSRTDGRRRARPATTTTVGARIVSTASSPMNPHVPSMRMSDHATIEQAGLQVGVPTIISAAPANNPLGRRVINPITPYELWGLKHPSLSKKRSNSLEPLGEAQLQHGVTLPLAGQVPVTASPVLTAGTPSR